jgi:CHAT domain-containing protein
VIGTLWTIEDGEAAELAKDVYRGIDDGFAQALHDATLNRRAGHEGEPTVWASAVHFGP